MVYTNKVLWGAYFPKNESLRLSFYFSIGQNYSPQPLDLLLNLQKILDVGRIKLEFDLKDQPDIR